MNKLQLFAKVAETIARKGLFKKSLESGISCAEVDEGAFSAMNLSSAELILLCSVGYDDTNRYQKINHIKPTTPNI